MLPVAEQHSAHQKGWAAVVHAYCLPHHFTFASRVLYKLSERLGAIYFTDKLIFVHGILESFTRALNSALSAL